MFATTFILRFITQERFPIVSDSIGYARGLIVYDIPNNEPGFPGYFLYVMTGRLLVPLIGGPLQTLTFLSVLFSAGVALLTFLIGRAICNSRTGFIASLLFLTSTTFWFFGIVALPYIVALFFHATVIWCIAEARWKGRSHLFLLPLSLTILLGIRPHEIINVGLPLLYYLGIITPHEKKRVVLTTFLLCLMWIIPLLSITGGIAGYLGLLLRAATDLQPPGIANTKFYATTLAVSFMSAFTIALLFYSYPVLYAVLARIRTGRYSLPLNRARLLFFSLWVVPIALFQVFLKSDHPAHTLALLLPATILLAYFIDHSVHSLINENGRKLILSATLSVVVVFNTHFFFRDLDSDRPQYLGYASIRANDRLFESKIGYIRETFNSQTTLIVSDHRQWRHAAYFLPYFQVYVFEDVSRQGSLVQNKVFTTYNNRTSRFERPQDSFLLPSNVRTIVFFENQFSEWVVDDQKQIIRLGPCCTLTALRINEHTRLTISYHQIARLP